MRTMMACICVISALCIGGCAGDGSELGEETGGTWGAGPWELPPQVKRSFAQKYPQATVAAWDRHNFEGGESVYDIVYHDKIGQSHSIRMSAMGEVLPQFRPRESQTQLAEQPAEQPAAAQPADQQAHVNEIR